MFTNSRILKIQFKLFLLFMGYTQLTYSQSTNQDLDNQKLSIQQAINYSKQNNKWVKIAQKEQIAVGHEKKDAVNAIFPQINLGAGYQRFSDLTLFTDGLGGTVSGPRKPSPNGANLGIDAAFNLYSGGKSKAIIEEAKVKEELALLYLNDQSGNIALQTVFQYLDLIRLTDLKRYLNDQMNRAQTRLKNINSLYNNQKVTKSDVLRAEVMLSNVNLNIEQVQNDIIITNQKLGVLLDLKENEIITPIDSAGMQKPILPSLDNLLNKYETSSYTIQRAGLNIQTQQAKLKGIRSNDMPSLYFTAAYNFTYPNYLFYPPVDQMYSIGFVGLKMQYNVSSLYQNKHKKSAASLRVEELKQQKEAVSDNVEQEIKSYYIKYGEALNKISVNEKSIEQAKVNYKIVSTKYFNQLSLLTDLLDADNLLQESRFNLVRAQTEALLIYYKLQYSLGNL